MNHHTAEHEPYCCAHCAPWVIVSCCDICNPEWTAGMLAMDSPPRTKHRPNKAKIDAHQPLTSELNSTLKLKLETFHKELHAKFWGDMKDTLIGPHLFLTNAQIQHLCHLAHANVLWDMMISTITSNGTGCLAMGNHCSPLSRVSTSPILPQIPKLQQMHCPLTFLWSPVLATLPHQAQKGWWNQVSRLVLVANAAGHVAPWATTVSCAFASSSFIH